MPRSNIIRSNRPGLMFPRRSGPAIRTPNVVSRSDVISYRPVDRSHLHHKIHWVPPISLSGAVRHLTYHIWPTKHHDIWKWNVDQLSQRWSLFNGKKCVGIVHDEQSHDPEVVLEYCRSLGMNWDFVFTAPNDSIRGELTTWEPKLEFLMPEYATQDEVVFYAHAKGTKYEEYGMNLPWSQMMYESNLDDWSVVRALLERKATAGSIRVRGGTDGFRYAGTFYWFRLAAVKEGRWKDIHPAAWGAEDWPARHFTWESSACIFADDDTLNSEESLNATFDRWREHARGSQNIRIPVSNVSVPDGH